MTDKKYEYEEIVKLDCGDCLLELRAESALVGYEWDGLRGTKTTARKKYPPTLSILLWEPSGWRASDHGLIAAIKRVWSAFRRQPPTFVEIFVPRDVDALISALQRGREMMDETWDPTPSVTP